jgi:uncharacterized membrane protein YqjE
MIVADDKELPIVGDDCRSATGRCEFSTLTASQLSTAAIILAYVVTRIAVAVIEGAADTNGIQLTIVSAITIVYIFLCFLLIEDIYIAHLRGLRSAYRWMEFALRVIVLMAISILPTFINAIPTLSNNAGPANRIAIFLIVLYLVFLAWDAVVYLGAPRSGQDRLEIQKIALRFLLTDGIGIGLLIAAAGSYYASKEAVAAMALFILIPFTFWFQIRKAFNDLAKSRFTGGPLRDMLR